MPYMLRFVQHFKPGDEQVFMKLEKEFSTIEGKSKDFPKGRRFQPYSGRDPRHTLVWQCEFSTIDELNRAIGRMAASEEHDRLFKKVAPTMIDSYTEIYEILDL